MGVYKKYQDLRATINGQRNPYFGLVYAKAVYLPKVVDTLELARRVQKNVSVKISDVYAVLAELSDVINVAICNSEKVKLDGLGILKAAISTSPADNFGEFRADKNIKASRIIFTPELDPERTNSKSRKEKTLLRGIDWTDVDQMVATAQSTNPNSVAKPTISAGAQVGDARLITMACETADATIFYSTDGSTPNQSTSFEYEQPFSLEGPAAGGNVTIKAAAFKDGVWSEITTKSVSFDPVMP